MGENFSKFEIEAKRIFPNTGKPQPLPLFQLCRKMDFLMEIMLKYLILNDF